MTHNAEHLGIFTDPEDPGLYFEVSRFQSGGLVDRGTNSIVPGYPLAALSLARAIGPSQRRARGLATKHEELAHEIMRVEGYYYVAQHRGTENEPIAAYGRTEETPGAHNKAFYMVNELEAVDEKLGQGRLRFAASAILHCMLRGLPPKTSVLFPTRQQGGETRSYEYLTQLGIAALPHAPWGRPGALAIGRADEIRQRLTHNYDLPK